MTDALAEVDSAAISADRRGATRALVRTTRRLIRAVTTTALSPALIAEADQRLAAVATTLEQGQRRRPLRSEVTAQTLADADAQAPWESFTLNPLGIPLQLWWEGEELRGTLDVEWHHEGPAGLLHGGFSAAVMDALLGAFVAGRGFSAVTATLDLQFRRGIAVGQQVALGARLVSVAGRKVAVEGWIGGADQCGGHCVEGHALFIVVPQQPVSPVSPVTAMTEIRREAGEGASDGHA